MTDLMDRRRYTFVTVGYDGETGLLRLQARSMRLYCSADLVDEIIIVDNSQPAASNRWRADLLQQYGNLAKLVRIIPGAELATEKGHCEHGCLGARNRGRILVCARPLPVGC